MKTIRSARMLRKIFTLTAGLFIMSLGIALSVKADMGLAPISCVPYIYSLRFSPTMGEIAIIMMVIFVILQIIILRKKYKAVQLVQLPAAVAFGYFIDFSRFLISDLSVSGYPGRLILCLFSCTVIAFGVFLEVKSELTYLPGEGLVAAMAECCGMDFGRVKVALDCFIVLFAAISSLLLTGKIQGIREGTAAAAILVGTLVRVYRKITEKVEIRFLHT